MKAYVLSGPARAAIIFGMVAVGAPAYAQSDRQAEASSTGDIIVTAQKRDQALLSVPLSITAITEEELVKRGSSSIEDLQYSIPGISITEFSPGQQRVQMRGVSVYSGLPTVGVYQDELPLNLEMNQTGQDVRLLDMKRIEVLRGPQGTLYGQGAVGGTIRYITNDVDLSRLSASASGEVAGIDGGGTDWKGEAMVNAPLVTDRVGLRLAGSYQRFGGWVDNPELGDSNVNSGHAMTLRGKLAMKPGERFTLTLMGQYQDLDLGGQNVSDDEAKVYSATATPYASKAVLLNAVATYEFDFATLLSSTSYIHRKDRITTDYTSILAPYVAPIGNVSPSDIDSITYRERPRNKVFSQELRLSSNQPGPLGWTIGGFFRDSRAHTSYVTDVTPNILPADYVLLTADGTNPDNSRSWAVFGEGSYLILPNLTALVGLRYFEDRRRQLVTSTSFGSTAVDTGEDTFHSWSPRFNLSWQPSANVNLYANVAKGFRSGGFNQTSSGDGIPPSYDPDTLWTYEIGGKVRSPDQKLSAELAAYRNVWTDVQTTTNVAGLPTSFTSNGGKITGWGVDGSLAYTPVPAFTLSLSGGWNDMTYRSASEEHLPGDPADYVPRFTGAVSAEYRATVADLPGFLRVDFQHSASFQVFLRNFQSEPVHSDEQNLLNARLGVSGERWSASLFARNLLNRYSVTYPAFGSRPYPARIEPRTMGVSFSVNY